MGNQSSIVFSGIAPHPPIMVPEVGGESVAQVRGSIDAMAEMTRRIIEAGAQTVILISPHAPLDPQAFIAYHTTNLYGDFAKFHAPSARVEFALDQELLETITDVAAHEEYEVLSYGNYGLDHGTAVPLYFLDRNGWSGRVVALGYSFLSNQDHLRFGGCIRKAVDSVGRPVAFVASGDLSHRLKPEAPAGYNPTAYRFDDEVVDALHQNSPTQIINIDQDLRRKAGECGFRSILIALAPIEELPEACEVLHYEAPFGVGYLVAQLTNATDAKAVKSTTKNEVGYDSLNTATDDEKSPRAADLPALARLVIETFVLTGKQLSAPDHPGSVLSTRAACFVSIKTRSGDLRGCIGTIEPVKQTLAEELIVNAVSAATRDPRFQPVAASELANLRYSVDVLSAPEPTSFQDLDPAIYGVIVEDESGLYRGLLLPDIAGVDTAAKQVDIAARKAGIAQGQPLKLSRFRVQRFSEE